MTFSHHLFFAALIATGSAVASEIPAIFIVDANERASIYAMQKFRPNEIISFQYPNANGDAACCKYIRLSKLAVKPTDDRFSEASSDKTGFRYAFRQRFKTMNRMPFVGMAVAAERSRVSQIRARTLLIHGGKKTFEINLCTSQEGVHVISRHANSPFSDLYYSLGYDVEPSCPAH